MATFTRLQLRTYQTDSADFSGARTFELINNLNTTAYFNIEGERLYVSESGGFVGHRYKDVFNSASLSSLVNCSVVTESIHAGFIITSNGKRNGAINMSGSVDTSVNGIKDSLTGTFSGSRKYLTATSLEGAFTSVSSSITDLTSAKLLSDFTSVSGSSGTYTNVSSSNTNLTASITLSDGETVSNVTNLTGDSGSLTIGSTVIFPSESLGATTADGANAIFTLSFDNFSSSYSNVSSSNFNLTASFDVAGTQIRNISNLTGESASLAIGDVIIFPSESLGADTADGADAKFTLTEATFTYTGVSASNADVTASLYLIESTSLGTVTVTSQGQEFTTGDTIIFPSQSFGATTADGEDITFTLKSSDIVSNGTASFVFTPSSTIAKEDVKFIASNTLVYNINDVTASGSAFGVDLNTNA